MTGQDRNTGWDWADISLMRAWGKLMENLCPKCGRPMKIHQEDKVEDYGLARTTCTATLSLEQNVARWRKSPEGQQVESTFKTQGYDPERSYGWIAYTLDEGAPQWE